MSVQNMEPSAEQFRIASLLDEKKFDAGTRLPADISKQYSQKTVVRPFYLAKMKNYESIYPSRGLGGASWGENTFSPQSPTHTESEEK